MSADKYPNICSCQAESFLSKMFIIVSGFVQTHKTFQEFLYERSGSLKCMPTGLDGCEQEVDNSRQDELNSTP